MLLRRNFTKRQKGRQACQPLVLNLGTTVIYHLLFEGCRRLSACVVELCVKRILELGVQRRAVRMTERRRWDGFQLAAFRLRQIAPQNQILKTGISSSTVFVTIFVVDVLLIYASFHAQNPLLAKTCFSILVPNVTRGVKGCSWIPTTIENMLLSLRLSWFSTLLDRTILTWYLIPLELCNSIGVARVNKERQKISMAWNGVADFPAVFF